MFKSGEVAVVKSDGRKVTIRSSFHYTGAVSTDVGCFYEVELLPAHPSVLATAAGRDLDAEVSCVRVDDLGKSEDLLPFELFTGVEEALKKASIDYNGHWKNGADFADNFNVLAHLYLSRDTMTLKDAEDLVRTHQTGVPLDRWVPVGAYLRARLRTCPCCGEEDFTAETNGLVVRLVGEPCKFPNGLPPTEWELNVPSGKLVIANDLRKVFPLPEDDRFDINTALGCHMTAMSYAANGLSHAFVGNSCPGVYKCTNGSFKIANPPSDEKWDGEDFVEIMPEPEFDGERIAGICTDLWWYSTVITRSSNDTASTSSSR